MKYAGPLNSKNERPFLSLSLHYIEILFHSRYKQINLIAMFFLTCYEFSHIDFVVVTVSFKAIHVILTLFFAMLETWSKLSNLYIMAGISQFESYFNICALYYIYMIWYEKENDKLVVLRGRSNRRHKSSRRLITLNPADHSTKVPQNLVSLCSTIALKIILNYFINLNYLAL